MKTVIGVDLGGTNIVSAVVDEKGRMLARDKRKTLALLGTSVALLPIPVRGEHRPCRWGLWVEVTEAPFGRVADLWDALDQAREPPFRATLANSIRGYPPTLGLPGRLHLTGPDTAPEFRLDQHLDHPLVHEQQIGVPPERILEWLHNH